MAVLVERISRLEEAVERFVEQSSVVFAAAAAIREDVAEIRASNARTDHALLLLRQESEESWRKFEHRLDKTYEESEERWRKFEHRLDNAHEESEERWKKFEQQAEKDREQAEKGRQEADKDRQQADKDRKDFNKRMAEISDRIGRFVEDMVHPNAARIAGKLFGGDSIETLAIRVKRRHPSDPSRIMELDLLVAGRRHVLIGEAKSTPTVEKADAFLEKAREMPDFFPEFAGHKVLPLMASVSFDPSLVAYFNRCRLYALGFGDDTMELLNEGAWQ